MENLNFDKKRGVYYMTQDNITISVLIHTKTPYQAEYVKDYLTNYFKENPIPGFNVNLTILQDGQVLMIMNGYSIWSIVPGRSREESFIENPMMSDEILSEVKKALGKAPIKIKGNEKIDLSNLDCDIDPQHGDVPDDAFYNKILGRFNDMIYPKENKEIKESVQMILDGVPLKKALLREEKESMGQDWEKDVHSAAKDAFAADKKLWDLVAFSPEKYKAGDLQDALNAFNAWYQHFLKIKESVDLPGNALKENNGDWDIQPEETVSQSDINKFEFEKEKKEFIEWEKQASEAIDDLSIAYSKFSKLLKNPWGIDFSKVKGCPFRGNLKESNVEFQVWLGLLKQYIDQENPYK